MRQTELEIIQQLSDKIAETTSLLYGLTARVDERTKVIVDKQNAHEIKIDRIIEDIENLKLRAALLEKTHDGIGSKIKIASDFTIKLILAVLSCWIIYKLGFK